MKQKNILILVFIMLFLCILTSCGSNKIGEHKDLVKVTFELEGGTYKNSQTPVKHYYDLKTEESMLIYELSDLTNSDLERIGYELVGWYKTKNVNGENVSYSDKWDFTKDKITKDGLTLYAYWKKITNFSFEVCYYDENNEVVKLGSYVTDPDDEETKLFKDRLKYVNNREGYTAIGYVDKDGNPWNDEFIHPCEEENPVVQVFGKYIKGEYTIVYDADDLINAANENIYLMNDIDMDGNILSLTDYKYIFEGNGYKISNFTIEFSGKKNDLVDDYDFPGESSIYTSLFGNMENAIVRNVTFENMTLTVNTTYKNIYRILVSPFATSIKNSTISNVSLSGEVIISKLPNGFYNEGTYNTEKVVIYTNQVYTRKDDTTTLDNVTINITVTNNLK